MSTNAPHLDALDGRALDLARWALSESVRAHVGLQPFANGSLAPHGPRMGDDELAREVAEDRAAWLASCEALALDLARAAVRIGRKIEQGKEAPNV